MIWGRVWLRPQAYRLEICPGAVRDCGPTWRQILPFSLKKKWHLIHIGFHWGRSQQNIFDINGFKCAIYFGRCRCLEVLPDGKCRGAPSHKPPSSQAFGPACTFLPRTRLLFLTWSLPIVESTFKTKLFIAFKKNWLVWYNLMILLRWLRLCAIGLI